MKIWDKKQSVDERAKLDYSPLGEVFDTGLTEEKKKRGFKIFTETVKNLIEWYH